MSFNVRFSRALDERLSAKGMSFSLFIDAGVLDNGEATEILFDVLNDIYSEVCDGDTVYLYESSEYGDPAYEFPLHVSDKYLGEFEFDGHSLKGTKVEDGDDMPYIRITEADGNGAEHEICTLSWITLNKDAETSIEFGLKRAADIIAG